MMTRKLIAVSALVAAAFGSVATSQARWEATDAKEADFELSSAEPMRTYAVSLAANDAAVPDDEDTREVALTARFDFDTHTDDAVVDGTLYQLVDDERVEIATGSWSAEADTDEFASLHLDGSEALAACSTAGCELEFELEVEIQAGSASGVLGVEAVFREIGTNDGPDDAELELILTEAVAE